MNRLKTTGAVVILLAAILVSLSPMASLAGAEETPSIKWVLVETSVNPNDARTEFRGGGSTPGYYTGARYDGKFDLYDVSETSFDVHTREWDRGLFWDVNIGCTFDAPPQELIPGESYELTVDFAHSVVEYNEVPRFSQQFSYDTQGNGIWLVLPDGMYSGNQFLYSPWHQDFTGENSKTWTLDVITKGAPFYGAPGDTWTLTAGWRGAAGCYVTWTYQAVLVTDSNQPCYPVNLENIFSAGINIGWAHMRAYWYALEAKPPMSASEASDIIETLTGLRDHLEASGFSFENYDAPIDSLIADLGGGVRTLDIPEEIGSLMVDPGGVQDQLKGKIGTLPSGEAVNLENIFSAGINIGWAHMRAYWYALEAKPAMSASEASDIIETLTGLRDHLEASGFPFENYDAPIDSLIADLGGGVRTLDIPEEIGSLMVDPGGVQAQLRGKIVNLCEDSPVLGACDWSGTWDTSWGTMELVQSGSQVTGTYDHQGGQITGTVSGNTLTGTWSEAPSYSPPNDAGDIEFTISPDCASFTGKWRYGNTGGWTTDWSGTRVSAPPSIPPTTACDIVGEWKWFTGVIVDFLSNGTFESPTLTGTWRVTGSMAYELTWSHGYTDDVIISADCQRLDGENQNGNTVWGTRISGADPTPTTPVTPPSGAPTLTFESRSRATGSSIQIPLTLSGAQKLIGNMDITLSYNTSVLQATDVIKGSLTGNSLFDHNIQGGTILISLAHNQGFSGDGTVAYIRFNVIGAAGSTSPLDIVDLSANGASDMATMNISAIDGIFTVLGVGDEEAIADCNGDGRLTVLDALCALQMAVDKKTEDLAMDINGDGKVTSLDARSILKIAVEDV